RSTGDAVNQPVSLVRNLNDLSAALDHGGVSQVLIDMNATGLNASAAIGAAKEAGVPRVVAFLSHVQTELADAARSAGATEVLARSEFSRRLPEILSSR